MTEYTAQGPKPGDGEGPIAGAGMSEEAELLFKDWFQSLVAQDIRYNTKSIGLLAREAMVDDQVRAQVQENPAEVLRANGSPLGMPDGFTVRFFENTATLLHVVLPPRAETVQTYFGSGDERLTAMRDRLRSRTAEAFPLFHDNWNWNDTATDITFGMIVPPA